MNEKPQEKLPAKQGEKPQMTIAGYLRTEQAMDKLRKVLPKHMTADRVLGVFLRTVNGNPKLAACSLNSLLECFSRASAAGLEIDGRHAHCIPYKGVATLVFDYKGLVSLVRRSGEVSDIHCDVVYSADLFEFEYGTKKFLRHIPNFKGEAGDVVAIYSWVKLRDGSDSFEVLSVQEVNNIRDNSNGYKAYKSGAVSESPWESNWGEMAKKTAFRRHTKWLPLSNELKESIVADDEAGKEESRFAAAKPVFETSPAALPAPQPDAEFFPTVQEAEKVGVEK